MPSVAAVLTYDPDRCDYGLVWEKRQNRMIRDLHRSQPHVLSMPNSAHPAPPSGCGVYFLWKDGAVQYVGQSVRIASRIGQHVGIKDFDSYSFIECEPEMLAFVESYWIHKLRPPQQGEPNRFGYLRAPLDPPTTEAVLECHKLALVPPGAIG